jgi:ATP-binding cassette subfamily B protein/subfamily B ATP-binding cassette protein MsbA
MPSGAPSSRRRYCEYLQKRREQRRKDASDAARKPLDAIDEEAKKDRERKKRHRSAFTLFKAFWTLLEGRRTPVLFAMGTNTITALLGLIMPAGTKAAIDFIVTDHPGPVGIPRWIPLADSWRDVTHRVSLLWLLCGFLMLVTLVRVSVATFGRWQMTRNTQRTKVALRRRVFEHAVRLPLHRVHQIKSGGVASLIREDAGGAGELLFHLFYNPWSAIVQLLGTLVVLAWVDWRMLIGSLILIPIVWMAHQMWISRIRPLYRDLRATRQGIDAHAAEAFGGMRVVRGFSRESGESARFVKGAHFMARQEILTWWWSRGIEIAWFVMIPLATTGVLLYGGLKVIEGRFTIGDVMMFSSYLMMMLGPLEMLAGSANEMQTNLAGLDRVLDLLEEPREFTGNEPTAQGRILDRASVRGRITLHDVYFTYPSMQGTRDARGWETKEQKKADEHPPEPVMHGVSLDVAPGQTIALVGPSGSGKTTLCNLVARFYDPSRGSVELDGENLREINVESYRALLGIVEQDVFLFDGTIAENIAYADRNASMERITEAARAANAADFIEKLDHGYQTLIGERGVRLSGGQKQRLAIARALLADPKILILDEATSNLDTESERLIQRSLRSLMKGRTCFVIAHRLSTIRHADRIVVIEGGRIIEQGTHAELIAQNGRYAEFLRIQLEGHGQVELEEERAGLPAKE